MPSIFQKKDSAYYAEKAGNNFIKALQPERQRTFPWAQKKDSAYYVGKAANNMSNAYRCSASEVRQSRNYYHPASSNNDAQVALSLLAAVLLTGACVIVGLAFWVGVVTIALVGIGALALSSCCLNNNSMSF